MHWLASWWILISVYDIIMLISQHSTSSQFSMQMLYKYILFIKRTEDKAYKHSRWYEISADSTYVAEMILKQMIKACSRFSDDVSITWIIIKRNQVSSYLINIACWELKDFNNINVIKSCNSETFEWWKLKKLLMHWVSVASESWICFIHWWYHLIHEFKFHWSIKPLFNAESHSIIDANLHQSITLFIDEVCIYKWIYILMKKWS